MTPQNIFAWEPTMHLILYLKLYKRKHQTKTK